MDRNLLGGNINAGVHQGSVLGPLLFLLFINDITFVIRHCSILFADDTCLFIELDNHEITGLKIDEDLQNIQEWSERCLVTFAPTKSKSLSMAVFQLEFFKAIEICFDRAGQTHSQMMLSNRKEMRFVCKITPQMV